MPHLKEIVDHLRGDDGHPRRIGLDDGGGTGVQRSMEMIAKQYLRLGVSQSVVDQLWHASSATPQHGSS